MLPLRDTRTLSVLWSDGQRNDFDVRTSIGVPMRGRVEEMSGDPLLDPKSVRPDVNPRTITSVGNTHHHQLERRSQHGDLLVRATCGPRVNAAQPGLWKMSEVYPSTRLDHIRAETSQPTRHVQVYGQPDSASGWPVLFRKQGSGIRLAPRRATSSPSSGVSNVLVAETVVTVGKDPKVSRGRR